MKTTYLWITIMASLVIVCCTAPKDKEAEQALKNYTQFVDSVVTMNDNWKMQPDTNYTETPTDPNDPTKVRIDTTVVSVADKASLSILKDIWGSQLEATYNQYNAAVESKLSKMDEPMKKKYETAKQKYETLK